MLLSLSRDNLPLLRCLPTPHDNIMEHDSFESYHESEEQCPKCFQLRIISNYLTAYDVRGD